MAWLRSSKTVPNDGVAAPVSPGARSTVLARLVELRSRATKAALCFGGIFVCLIPFADRVFSIVAEPILVKLPPDSELIARSVASPFLTPLKATMWASLFLAMPLLLYHVWRFVELWLKAHGRRIALPFIVASAVLFYGGVAFAFFFVLPMVFGFFTQVAPAGVKIMTDITAYLDFTIAMLLAFGLAFQVPIAIVILVWTRLVSRQALAAARPYVFLGAFVVGMLITPPDVFSQTLLAVPIYLLYEASLFFCKRFLPEES
jgi:sec-independent protein translocase protein TatC